MIPNAKINDFERLFDSCVFMRRYLDQASDEALGAIYAGDAGIAVATGIRQPKVLSLDGTGDWILYPNDQALDIKTDDFTIEFGINTTDVAAFICGKRNGAGNGWAIKTATGPDINFQIDDGTEISGNNTTALSAGYHHVAIVADRSGNATFYIDGSTDGTLNISGSAGSLTNITQFTVGVDGDGSSNPLNGQIPFIRFWKNRLLTPTEINQLAAGEGFGSGNPLMGFRNQGLVSYWPLGNVTGDQFPDIVGSNTGTGTNLTEADLVAGYNQYRQAIDFDGSSEYIIASNNAALSITANLSISLWAKTNTMSANAGMVGKYDAAGGQRSYTFFLDNDGIPDFALSSTTSPFNGADRLASTDIDDNAWHYLVATYDTSNMNIYIDGVLSNGTLIGSVPASIADSPRDLVIGAGYESSTTPNVDFFTGLIQDVLIYNRTLTGLEVEMLYKRQKRGLKI